MNTWTTSCGRVAATLAVLLLAVAEAGAQPAGMIDPLYEHRCNKVVDADVAWAGKDALRAKLVQANGLYTRSMELARYRDAQAALRDMLAFKQAIASLVAPTHHVFVDAQLRAAALWSELRDSGRALEEIDSAVRMREDCLGADDPFTLEALSMKAQVLERIGQSRAALKVSEEILQRQQRGLAALGPAQAPSPAEQKRSIVALANVAGLAYRVGDYPRARAGAQQTVEAASQLSEDDIERYELLNSAWYCLNRVAYFTRDAQGQRSVQRRSRRRRRPRRRLHSRWRRGWPRPR